MSALPLSLSKSFEAFVDHELCHYRYWSIINTLVHERFALTQALNAFSILMALSSVRAMRLMHTKCIDSETVQRYIRNS